LRRTSLGCAGEGCSRELRGRSLNCSHSVKFFGQIDAQEQGTDDVQSPGSAFAPVHLGAAYFAFRHKRIHASLAQAMTNAIHAESKRLSLNPILSAMGFIVVGASTLKLLAVTRGLGVSIRGEKSEG
jgi:hypothetical protein